MGERKKKCETDQLSRESCSRFHQYELFKIFSQLNSATYIISPIILIKKKKRLHNHANCHCTCGTHSTESSQTTYPGPPLCIRLESQKQHGNLTRAWSSSKLGVANCPRTGELNRWYKLWTGQQLLQIGWCILAYFRNFSSSKNAVISTLSAMNLLGTKATMKKAKHHTIRDILFTWLSSPR